MNREAIQKTRDAIAKEAIEGLSFDLGYYYGFRSRCGAVACIAGWVVAANLGTQKLKALGPGQAIFSSAAEIIQVSDESALALFEPNFSSFGDRYGIISYDYVLPSDAVEVLDRLLETGSVDWTPTVEKIIARINDGEQT